MPLWNISELQRWDNFSIFLLNFQDSRRNRILIKSIHQGSSYHQLLLVFLLEDGAVVILVFRHDIGKVETWQRRCVHRKWNCKPFHSLSGTHIMSENCELLKEGEFDFHFIVTHISTFKTSALVTSSPESQPRYRLALKHTNNRWIIQKLQKPSDQGKLMRIVLVWGQTSCLQF